jgi:hypothetical protein
MEKATPNTDSRIARTEALFREVNERIAERADLFGSDEASFVCECADAACTERIEAPLDEYEDVRDHGAQFLLAKGHEQVEVERVVRRFPDFNVVRKMKPAVRRMVERLNPRAEPV